MGKPNPFEEMENKQIQTFFKGPVERKIKSGLNGTLGTVRFLGNIADVYLTHLVDTVVGMASGPNADDEDGTIGESDDGSQIPEPKYPSL